ncbi:MAG TPA: hypothetical protein VHD36_03295 [Pirellulales bacterium]|nr:hypothetical protein [Pirellulales bacterium]
MFTWRASIGALLLAALSTVCTSGQERRELPGTGDKLAPPRPLQQEVGNGAEAPTAQIDVQPLSGGDKANGGAVTIEFDVHAPKGTRFYVFYTHPNVRGGSSTNSAWKIAGDEPARRWRT